MHATMKAIQACQDLHYIGMAINMLAVSCLPTYRAIAIPVPDQSAKLAVVYCFSHFIWQAVPDLGPIMDKIDLSPYLDVFALGKTAVLSFRMEYWEHFSMMRF